MPHPHRPLLVLLVVLLGLATAACDGADEGAPAGTADATLVETSAICNAEGLASAVSLGPEEGTLTGMADDPVGTAAGNNPVLRRLTEALRTAELLDTLDNAEALTIFAPTDCAFAEMDQATLESALADPAGLLTQVLGFHVIPGQRLSEADLTGQSLETFSGQTLNYIAERGSIVLDGQARILVPDIQTANATVHLISDVMIPGTGAAADAGAPAPGPSAESTEVCDTNALVEAVESGTEEGTLAGMADDPVAVAASNNPVLTTLVEAVVAAGLVDTLNSAEALTVFAPTDCAFARLDPSTLEAALADPSGLLTDVLGFHVVPGQRLQFDDLTGGELETISGIPLPYALSDNVVTLNGQAQIVVPNIQTANATVHLVDTVMLPPTE